MAGKWSNRVHGGYALRKKAIEGRDNEDSVLCCASDGAIGVFDGIGSYAEARMASKIARERCAAVLSEIDTERFAQIDQAMDKVSKAILAAQEGITDLQRMYPQAGDGGTTASIVKLWQNPETKQVFAIFANIGDSRIYYWKNSEKDLYRLTRDDNVLLQWMEYGWVQEEDIEKFTDLIDDYTGTDELPPIASEAWDHRNTICAWLGMPDISFRIGAIEMQIGDVVVATTDGIHDNLTSTEIKKIIAEHSSPRETALRLVDVAAAVAAVSDSPRAKPDDMAVAVLELE